MLGPSPVATPHVKR